MGTAPTGEQIPTAHCQKLKMNANALIPLFRNRKFINLAETPVYALRDASGQSLRLDKPVGEILDEAPF